MLKWQVMRGRRTWMLVITTFGGRVLPTRSHLVNLTMPHPMGLFELRNSIKPCTMGALHQDVEVPGGFGTLERMPRVVNRRGSSLLDRLPTH